MESITILSRQRGIPDTLLLFRRLFRKTPNRMAGVAGPRGTDFRTCALLIRVHISVRTGGIDGTPLPSAQSIMGPGARATRLRFLGLSKDFLQAFPLLPRYLELGTERVVINDTGAASSRGVG